MPNEETVDKKANPTRINDTLLGPLEKRFIRWFEHLAPDWVSPDLMTMVGMVGTLLTLIGYILTRQNSAFLWLASFGFFLNWLGDSLDGNLARMRHIERPRFGYFVDHSLDTITMLCVFVGIGLTPHVNMLLALLTLVAYLLMNIYVYINTQVTKEFRISYAKLGPTEGRVMFVFSNTVMFFVGMQGFSLFNIQLSIYDVYFIGWAIFLFVLFFGNVFKGLVRLYHEDPPKKYVRPGNKQD